MQSPIFYQIYKQTSNPSVNPAPTEPNCQFVIFDSFTSSSSNDAELQALLDSVEGRYSKVPGFKRVRQCDAEDIVVSGLGTKPDDKDKVPKTLLYIGECDGGFLFRWTTFKLIFPSFFQSIFSHAEFESDPTTVLTSTEYQSLESWFDQALEPFIVKGMRETRAFKLFKEYEPTAALKDVAGK
jgi:hypothetical protein